MKPTRAIEYCTQSLDIVRKIEYRKIEGEALCTLGKAYSDLGQIDKAIDHCDQALKIFKKMEYRRGEGEALFTKSLALAQARPANGSRSSRKRSPPDLPSRSKAPRPKKSARSWPNGAAARRRISMQVIFLGTNGWYDSPTGNTICTLINSDKYHIILDAGNGLYKADRYIKDDLPVYLFLSHFHLDHIEGLHVLSKFRFPSLTIFGQKGTKQALNTIINEPFTVPLDKLPYPVEVRELSPGPYKLPFALDCRFLVHASPCLGYRFDLDGKIITYCPDTGVCENAVLLAADADLLIAECAHLPGEENPAWPHLNPEDAAAIARQAKAKRLALTHFDAGRYTSLQMRREAVATVQDFPGIVVGEDDLVLQL